MRLFLLFIVSTLYTFNVFGQQDSTTVDQDSVIVIDTISYNPANKVTVTKDTISFASQSNSSPSFKSVGNPEGSLLMPIDGASPQTLTASLAAGRTTGTIDISATGSATYAVPISLPPGISGVAPQIALTYNSQTGNGIAGYGWSISGLSSISRIPASRFHDGRVGNINFDSKDRFALDGQRLILKSGTYGGDGAEYQTENYSNVKIVSKGVSPYGANYGPQYFEVSYPDGTKAIYGNSADSRNQLTYAVTYTENPLGARINYYYVSSNNAILISQITYGSLNTNPTINQINFSYNNRSRREQSFIGGVGFYNDQILSSINVMANGTGYRNYHMTYDEIATLNYQRLVSISEENGDQSETFAPINFSYNNQSAEVINTGVSNLSLSGINQTNSKIITADFTGNGTMDFILYPTAKNKIYTFWDPSGNSPYTQFGAEVNTGNFEDIFPVSWLNSSNKFMTGQGFVLVKYIDNSTIKFETYSAGTTSPVYYQYEKEWDNVPTNGYVSSCTGNYVDEGRIPRKFISGDFNGDGLTDIISISLPYQQYYDYTDPNCTNSGDPGGGGGRIVPIGGGGGNCCLTSSYLSNYSGVTLINLDRRNNTNFVTNIGSLTASLGSNDQIIAADFNGDGKTDILQITEGKMYVYSVDDNNYLQLLWQTTDSRIKLSFPALLGDYNGDGKADVMFPTSANNYPNNQTYAQFFSTGNAFQVFEQNISIPYVTPYSYAGNLTLVDYVPVDINGDGKTDIVRVTSNTSNNSTIGNLHIDAYHNIGNTSSTPAVNFASGGFINSNSINLIHYPIPVFLTEDKPNYNLELSVIGDHTLNQYKFNKDLKDESLIHSISQDGVIHQITYKPLIYDDNYNDELQIYQDNYDQTYPYIDIHAAPGLKVVSKLERLFQGATISKVFGYEGAVSHAEGLGFLGFSKTIASDWFTPDEQNKHYTINIANPQLRGAVIKSFTSKSSYISSSIENASANNDGAALSDYITRTDYTYDTSLSPEKVFINTSTNVLTKDLLYGKNTSIDYTYDNYKNITKEVSNFSGEGTQTTEITYDNSTGTPYYIGRPLTKKTTTTNDIDAFSTEEQYTYTGYLLTQINKKGNGTSWVTENRQYDAYGNITRKGITAGGVERVNTMQYDASGRFMTKSTDLEGLQTNYTYNTATGNILTKTDPYGHITSYTYDNWGRPIQSTDYLGVNSYTSYLNTGNGDIEILETSDEGTSNSTTSNALGLKIETISKDVLGQFIGKKYEYDAYDRLINESEPAIGGSYSQWNATSYDGYGRVINQTAATGKSTNISYNGLSVAVNDGTKTVTTTKNALGNVISVQDPGGTINYTYYANGHLKTADFDGSTQSIEQDGWGHKTMLTDPSAGVYTYQYNDFGDLLLETTPKGNTQYTYDTNGKLLSKRIQGDHTDMSYQYTYDGSTKLLTSLALTNLDGNNTNYTYTYDTYKRLQSTVEDNSQARFTTSYTFDSFGRVATEMHQALNKRNNITVNKSITNSYQNGQLQSFGDSDTGEIIWTINGVNARGQVTSAYLADQRMRQSNSYDSFGFPQEIKIEQAYGGTLLDLGYSFNAQTGNVMSRTNSLFSWSESFSYDSQDRLLTFNDNNGNKSQSYDNKGRINNNASLGDYAYNGNSYQQTGLNNITLDAWRHYQDRVRQDISYNAFKSPVEIAEQGKEKISFQYNGALGRAHMYYGDETADQMSRPYRRHYSEDGGVEITEDIPNGITSFVFYLGGDAYGAPAIWKEIHTSITTTQALYYLHRDHLGSIVLITDNQGNAVEKRQFDAWGNIVKLEDGNGNALTDFVITDRGYTGHEHLLGVGLIHMNGRLYDPLLHRFLQPDNFVQFPYNSQNYNRYAYVLNNPLIHNDPSGEILPFIAIVGIAALITGSANLAVKAFQGKINSWGDGFTAFGIGAVAGAAGALSGGAALAASGLAGSSIAGGALAGLAGAAVASPIQGIGNSIAFGDSYNFKSYLKDLGFGALGGAIIGGATAYFKGNNVWLGNPIGNGRNPFSLNNSDKWSFKIGETTAIFENSGNIYQNGEFVGNTNNEVRSIVKYESYPSNDGFLGSYSENTIIKPGTVINRFGSEYGNYFSNVNGTPENLSLPPSNNGTLTQYKVIKPFPVRGGIAAPYYGRPGGGVQFLSERTIEWLRINKYIVKLP